jgi:hypothetical protein
MMGTSVAFVCAAACTLLAMLVSAQLLSNKVYPQLSDIRSVPLYLWFSGGALSAFGVSVHSTTFYYCSSAHINLQPHVIFTRGDHEQTNLHTSKPAAMAKHYQ